jgi:hypothetical protein
MKSEKLTFSYEDEEHKELSIRDALSGKLGKTVVYVTLLVGIFTASAPSAEQAFIAPDGSVDLSPLNKTSATEYIDYQFDSIEDIVQAADTGMPEDNRESWDDYIVDVELGGGFRRSQFTKQDNDGRKRQQT